MRIDVLGAVRARSDDGDVVNLGGPRHREVLGRLVGMTTCKRPTGA